MEHQKQQILVQAESLFLRYGIKSVTMDDLARELGVSKKTLYQYIENKADLISQIILNHVEEETDCINSICDQTLNAVEQMLVIGKYVVQQLGKISPTVVYDLKKYYRQSWELMEMLHRQHVYQVIVKNIEKGIKEGLYRENLNTDVIAKLYVGKTFLLVDEDIFPLKNYEKEHLFREFIFYHLFGIVSQKGLKTLEKLIPRYLTT
ncbi:MAG TPA: TetR/AcrR family transcriptional regulator [Saprospiraceae bacterium]|nr:TetR/AcrR family transcriptional regulator [Saprospiraceae bacterium]